MGNKPSKNEGFGEAEYRLGALERLQEAQTLLRHEQLSGSIYLAGRGVEGMLRAVIWKRDAGIRAGKKQLDTGHDLRELLTHVRNLGVLGPTRLDEKIEANVQKVARLWSNNMRYMSRRYIERRWRKLGEIGKGRQLKRAAIEYVDACSVIIKRGEALCQF